MKRICHIAVIADDLTGAAENRPMAVYLRVSLKGAGAAGRRAGAVHRMEASIDGPFGTD
jgi:hypothetical protein